MKILVFTRIWEYPLREVILCGFKILLARAALQSQKVQHGRCDKNAGHLVTQRGLGILLLLARDLKPRHSWFIHTFKRLVFFSP